MRRPRHFPKVDIEAICKSYSEGITMEQLAKIYKTRKRTIKKHLLDSGLKLSSKFERNLITLEQEQDVCNLYSTGTKINELCSKYKLSDNRINDILIRNSIPIKTRGEKIAKSINIDEVCKAYFEDDNTIMDLKKKFDISRQRIKRIFKNKNIELKSFSEVCTTYKKNESYFEKIDTEDKAYFLGLLYADGCVKDGAGTTDPNITKLSLEQTDKDLVYKFSEKIFVDNPQDRPYFVFSEGKGFSKKGIKYKDTTMCSLVISNQKIAQDLCNLGCTPRKSFTITFPYNHLDKSLYNHFIRGYFDGDGSIFCDGLTKSQYIITYTGTKPLLSEIGKIIYKNLNIETKIRPEHKYSKLPDVDKKPHTLVCGYNIDVYNLALWMYNGATIFMQRKYDRFKALENLLKTQGKI